MNKSKPCPACTNKFARGKPAHVLIAGELVATQVCGDCAEKGVLIVVPSAVASARAVMVPMVLHLRKIAKAYELNEDGRSDGLRQAADILESGRAITVEAPHVPIASVPPRHVNGAAKKASADRVVTPLLDTSPDNGTGLSKADRRILSAVAHDSASRKKLAIVAGYSARSGGFATALARLRARGYLATESGAFSATPAGLKALGPVEPLPRGPALISHWVERLNPCEGAILQRLASAYPAKIDRHSLGEETGYSENSGGFASALAKLRTLELIEGLRASSALMESAT